MTDISVILISYNTIDLTRKSLQHILDSTHSLSIDIFVVDNNSKDNSAEILRREFPNINLIENKTNVGFGRANNQVLPYIKSQYVLLLNSDAFLELDTIDKTVVYMNNNPQCGILGVKFIDNDGMLQPSCRYFPTPLNIFLNRTGINRFINYEKMVDNMNWDHASIRNCDWVPGCYFLIRKKVIDQVGFFDPRYFLYYEEIDLCFKAKKVGWEVTFYPHTSVVHLGGESAKSEGKISSSGKQLESLRLESEFLYFRKNIGIFSAFENILLITIADCLLTFKDIIKFKHYAEIKKHINHNLIAWSVFIKTRVGSKPIH